MTLETLIEKLQELSREWKDYSPDQREDYNIGVEDGLFQAHKSLDSLISQAQQPPTDTTP